MTLKKKLFVFAGIGNRKFFRLLEENNLRIQKNLDFQIITFFPRKNSKYYRRSKKE